MAGWTVVSGCDSWQTGGETSAQRRDGFQAHIARALHGPLIVLFEQQSTDEFNNGRFGRPEGGRSPTVGRLNRRRGFYPPLWSRRA